jgi:hypothetical protein
MYLRINHAVLVGAWTQVIRRRSGADVKGKNNKMLGTARDIQLPHSLKELFKSDN